MFSNDICIAQSLLLRGWRSTLPKFRGLTDQGCPHLDWKQYGQLRYKFGRLGDVVEKVMKGQHKTEDDLFPGYLSDDDKISDAGVSRAAA